MKIYTDSWHYRYVAKTWTENPESLCWYFWKIVLTIIGMFILGAVVVFLGIGILFFLTFPLWYWFYSNYASGDPYVSMVLWIAVGSAASYWYRQWLYESDQLKKKVKIHREPGLVNQYLHAKHRKICPLLNYVRRP